MPTRHGAEGAHVLIAAPFGSDASNLARLVESCGLSALPCPSPQALTERIDDRTGVIVVTDEALRGDLSPLREALERQAEWSDVPFILLTARNPGHLGSGEHARLTLEELTTNLIVLERPLGSASLLSAIKAALRARARQFDLRDRLAELRVSQTALAESEAQMRLIADALPVLIGFVDKDLIFRFANMAYRDWFYRDPANVVGRHVGEIVGAEGLKARLPAMRQALAGTPARFIQPWPHADGRRREAEIRYLPRRNAEGDIDGFHVFVADVTDHIEGEEVLRLTAQALEARVKERTAALEAEIERRAGAEAALRQSQKMEAVGQLTGGIAHDFNNMLTGVIGALDMINRRRAAGRDQDVERYMETALASAHRAAGLTHRLLTFSRRQSLDPRALDVDALVRSLEDLIQRTVSEQITVDLRLAAQAPAIADANQLESAILNLAINARDAMPSGGRLTIETSTVEIDARYVETRPDIRPGRYAVISVSDTGVGMSQDLVEKVFEPFFTTKPIGQGTGLGLSMVYGFAKQSGGHVRIHSQPGLGASVKIFLPVAEGGIVAPPQRPPPASAEGAGRTVLLVEDEVAVRHLVREVLEELGFRAIEVAESQAAIGVLRSSEPIHLMISDVGLPGMNGRALADVARDARPELAILFITGYAENATTRSGFLGPNMEMISKPFALDALAAKIGEMMPSPLSEAPS